MADHTESTDDDFEFITKDPENINNADMDSSPPVLKAEPFVVRGKAAWSVPTPFSPAIHIKREQGMRMEGKLYSRDDEHNVNPVTGLNKRQTEALYNLLSSVSDDLGTATLEINKTLGTEQMDTSPTRPLFRPEDDAKIAQLQSDMNRIKELAEEEERHINDLIIMRANEPHRSSQITLEFHDAQVKRNTLLQIATTFKADINKQLREMLRPAMERTETVDTEQIGVKRLLNTVDVFYNAHLKLFEEINAGLNNHDLKMLYGIAHTIAPDALSLSGYTNKIKAFTSSLADLTELIPSLQKLNEPSFSKFMREFSEMVLRGRRSQVNQWKWSRVDELLKSPEPERQPTPKAPEPVIENVD